MSSRRPFSKVLPGTSGILVESGTCYGDGVQAALDAGYKEVHSYEVVADLYQKAVTRFADAKKVKLYLKSSKDMYSDIHQLEGKLVFWLDGHYSSGPTGYVDKFCPLLEELDAIARLSRKDHTILVDDCRLLGTADFNGVTLAELKRKILSINPDYKFSQEDGHVPGDVLVAAV